MSLSIDDLQAFADAWNRHDTCGARYAGQNSYRKNRVAAAA